MRMHRVAVCAILAIFGLNTQGPARAEEVPKELTTPRFQIRKVLDADDKGEAVLLKRKDEQTGRDEWRLGKDVLLESADVADAKIIKGQGQREQILMTLTNAGKKKFAEATKANISKRIAMIVDGKIVGAPNVNSEIPGGQCIINTGKEDHDLKKIVEILRAGAATKPATTQAR